MKKYIDKAVVVAEIIDKINKYTKRGEESDAKRDGYGMYWGGVLSCLNEIRTLCDTLEVKESLTWEDIRELYIIFAEIDTEIELCKTDIQAETIGYYQEVLKRFKQH